MPAAIPQGMIKFCLHTYAGLAVLVLGYNVEKSRAPPSLPFPPPVVATASPPTLHARRARARPRGGGGGRRGKDGRWLFAAPLCVPLCVLSWFALNATAHIGAQKLASAQKIVNRAVR